MANVANIIHLDKARHREAQLNLPWYVADELDPPERARIEAHLAVCTECQADLMFEYRLRGEYAGSPADVERHWADVQRRLGALERPRESRRKVFQQWLGALGDAVRSTSRHWLRAAVVVQAGLILLLVALPRGDEPAYRALGAAPATDRAAGNIVVIFNPSAAEQDLRATLNASNARVVDGPLAADAYLLSVPAEERDAALSTLRASAAIASAEPIDPEGSP